MAGIIQLDDRNEWCADSELWELVTRCLRELVDLPGVRESIDRACETGIYWFSLQELTPAEALLVRGAILTQLRSKAFRRRSMTLPQGSSSPNRRRGRIRV